MIYLDNHATTAMDRQAVEAMLPLMTELYANPGSASHAAGRQVAELVAGCLASMASMLHASADELIITSGATESNNLALLGACLHPRQKRRKVISCITEHHAVLDPVKRLEGFGFDVVLIPVHPQTSSLAGQIDLQRLEEVLDDQTAVVSVMLANNEIGVIQPIAEIAAMCRQHGCWLHVDAAQAIGRIEVDVDALDVDLLSFASHKFYGPKGVGGLFVRHRDRRVRLQSQIVGGGQQHNLRSGTLNSLGIVGMEAAMRSTLHTMQEDQQRIAGLRNRLWDRLTGDLSGGVQLNGPALASPAAPPRLNGNLNCCFYPVEGQSLMLAVPDVAVSSGSACSSSQPAASHVLLGLGLTEEQARSSLRFGIGKFNTESDIDWAAEHFVRAARDLAKLL